MSEHIEVSEIFDTKMEEFIREWLEQNPNRIPLEMTVFHDIGCPAMENDNVDDCTCEPHFEIVRAKNTKTNEIEILSTVESNTNQVKNIH